MEYYIEIDNEKQGPYSLKELSQRKIIATTLVMPTDTQQWIPAWQIEELRPILEGKDPIDDETTAQDLPYVEATPVEPATQQAAAPQTVVIQKKSHTGCLLGTLIVLVAFIIVLILTCPKPEQHKDVLSDVITNTVNDAVNDTANTTGNELVDNAFRSISNAFAGKVIRSAVDDLVTVDNHIIYSTGKVHYAGQNHTVSVGLLGHIFTIDEDDLQEAARQYYKNSEVNLKEQIRQKVQKMIQDNIVEPATSTIEDLVGGALNGLLDNIGLGNSKADIKRQIQQSTDSIL